MGGATFSVCTDRRESCRGLLAILSSDHLVSEMRHWSQLTNKAYFDSRQSLYVLDFPSAKIYFG